MNAPPLTLAFDASTDVIVVALGAGDRLLASDVREARAQVLLSSIQQVLDTAQVGATDIDRILVGVGPGRFTSIRIAVATARSLALTLSVPLGGASTLAIVAQPLSATTGTHVWADVDARRGERFVQRWRWIPGIAGMLMIHASELMVVPIDDVGTVVGSEPVASGVPTPQALLKVASGCVFGDPLEVLPVYGREPDAVPRARVAP